MGLRLQPLGSKDEYEGIQHTPAPGRLSFGHVRALVLLLCIFVYCLVISLLCQSSFD
jgi:hypothetical protein